MSWTEVARALLGRHVVVQLGSGYEDDDDAAAAAQLLLSIARHAGWMFSVFISVATLVFAPRSDYSDEPTHKMKMGAAGVVGNKHNKKCLRGGAVQARPRLEN